MDASVPSPRKANYTVKAAEVIAAGRDLQVRLLTLAPDQTVPWHYHSEITDHYFVLKGALTVETRSPDVTRTFAVGERHQLTPGTPHLLSNHGSVDCQFLLLQGVGKYDWVKAEAKAERR
jgi:quercetin dioxygenase-like cupin family protein